jgi:hypothetical protein
MISPMKRQRKASKGGGLYPALRNFAHLPIKGNNRLSCSCVAQMQQEQALTQVKKRFLSFP